jgi:hypothetical protein
VQEPTIRPLFLASNVSSWVTGITLDIAGGKIMV